MIGNEFLQNQIKEEPKDENKIEEEPKDENEINTTNDKDNELDSGDHDEDEEEAGNAADNSDKNNKNDFWATATPWLIGAAIVAIGAAVVVAVMKNKRANQA